MEFFSGGCGVVPPSALQMKFIGISNSATLSQPLHHVMRDELSLLRRTNSSFPRNVPVFHLPAFAYRL